MIKDVYSNYLILHNIIILLLFLCVYICCVYCCERVFICWCFGVRSVLRVCVLVCEVSLLVFACVYVCVCSCLYIVIIRVLYVQCVCFRLCQYWYICVFCNLVHVSVCRCVSGRCVCGRLRVFERFIFITSAYEPSMHRYCSWYTRLLSSKLLQNTSSIINVWKMFNQKEGVLIILCILL